MLFKILKKIINLSIYIIGIASGILWLFPKIPEVYTKFINELINESTPLQIFAYTTISIVAAFIVAIIINFLSKKEGAVEEKMIIHITWMSIGLIVFIIGFISFSTTQYEHIRKTDKDLLETKDNFIKLTDQKADIESKFFILKAISNTKTYSDLLPYLNDKLKELNSNSSIILDGCLHNKSKEEIDDNIKNYNIILEPIMGKIKETIGEEIDLTNINKDKYDINRELPEENKIITSTTKSTYRKYKLLSTSNKNKLNNLISKIDSEIKKNNNIINEYVKSNKSELLQAE